MDLTFLADGLKGAFISAPSDLMQRGCADLIEKYVERKILSACESMENCSAEPAKTKRSIEDVLVKKGGYSVYVDVKSKMLGAEFSMPNLISVARLRKLYDDPENSLVYLFVSYEEEEGGLRIVDVNLRRVEELKLKDLQVANLGKGQLQIRQGIGLPGKYGDGRSQWMQDLKSLVVAFYDDLIEKTRREQARWV